MPSVDGVPLMAGVAADGEAGSDFLPLSQLVMRSRSAADRETDNEERFMVTAMGRVVQGLDWDEPRGGGRCGRETAYAQPRCAVLQGAACGGRGLHSWRGALWPRAQAVGGGFVSCVSSVSAFKKGEQFFITPGEELHAPSCFVAVPQCSAPHHPCFIGNIMRLAVTTLTCSTGTGQLCQKLPQPRGFGGFGGFGGSF